MSNDNNISITMAMNKARLFVQSVRDNNLWSIRVRGTDGFWYTKAVVNYCDSHNILNAERAIYALKYMGLAERHFMAAEKLMYELSSSATERLIEGANSYGLNTYDRRASKRFNYGE